MVVLFPNGVKQLLKAMDVSAEEAQCSVHGGVHHQHADGVRAAWQGGHAGDRQTPAT